MLNSVRYLLPVHASLSAQLLWYIKYDALYSAFIAKDVTDDKKGFWVEKATSHRPWLDILDLHSVIPTLYGW